MRPKRPGWPAPAERAVHLLEDALERTRDVLLRADIHYLRGRALLRSGSVMAGHDILVEGATQVQALDPGKATAMLAEAAWGLLDAGAVDRLSETARRAWDLSVSAPGDERAMFFGSIAHGMALILSGQDAAEGARLVRRATVIMERSDSLYRSPQMVAWTAMGPLWLRENATGRDLLYRAIDLAREQGAVGELPRALSALALDSASSDRWPAAHAQFGEVIRLARETGQPTLQCMALASLSRLEARQGRADDCAAHAAEALALADRFGLGVYRIWAGLGLSELALGVGLPDDTIRHADAVRRWLDELGILDPDVSPIPELVLAYMQVGRLADARDTSQEYARLAREKGQPWAMARAARCTGLLADETAFERHFVDALRFHDLTPDSFERARTLLHYGERLRRVRRRIDARVQLRAAFATFEHLGAAPWAERARVELLATGETARRRDAEHDRSAHAAGIPDRPTAGRGCDDTRSCRQAVSQSENDRVPLAERIQQTRHSITFRADQRVGRSGALRHTRASAFALTATLWTSGSTKAPATDSASSGPPPSRTNGERHLQMACGPEAEVRS